MARTHNWHVDVRFNDRIGPSQIGRAILAGLDNGADEMVTFKPDLSGIVSLRATKYNDDFTRTDAEMQLWAARLQTAVRYAATLSEDDF